MDYIVILNVKEHNLDNHDYTNTCDDIFKINDNKISEPILYSGCLIVWHLSSNLTSKEIYDKIVKNIVENDDNLLVIEMNSKNMYGYGKSGFLVNTNNFWNNNNENEYE